MREEPKPSSTISLATRLRRRLRSFEPMHIALLGLLSLPGYVIESLAFLQVFALFFLVFFWPFVAPLVDVVLRRGSDEDSEEPTDWIHLGDWRAYAAWMLMMPLTFLNPLVMTQDLLQLFGSAVAFARHRGSFPDPESYEQRVPYRLPFDGTWTVVNGSHDQNYSHSWFPVNQRYAYDFVITDDDGRTSPENTGAGVENYYCYEEPIRSPAAGVVVDAFETDFEASYGGGLSHPLKRDIRGCYVVIQHAPDEYSCLAHLVPGSLTVAPGDCVDRGELVGRCGHSGNSSEPHLHFQIQDHPVFELSAGLPVAFDGITIQWPGAEASDIDSHPGLDENRAGERLLEADTGDQTTVGDGGPNDESSSHRDEAGPARSYISAGQRVTYGGENDGNSSHRSGGVPSDADEPLARSSDDSRAGIATVRRTCFGVCVGAIVTFFGSIVVSGGFVALLLGAGLAIGVAARVGFAVRRGNDFGRRANWIGTALGVGLVAGVLTVVTQADPFAGVGPQSIAGLFFSIGFTGYGALGEFNRRRLGDRFAEHSVDGP
ncbi:peptidoglycan DD-metalloendopeptidase family protein [Natrinema halophilum]|uniref:Peptidoglycan DD-metalloendopeptidase family protein n=1 Tax=Natrinema halophilum TaxID=1699371 RepID=A0A7D5GTX3_9EURY|nr:peptidoglycan DD-metalloendopeptidase family protein [Natrinema halophilum]QLG50409.1 M23 family metallopeptidase [Natrinema halophilum]